jgi:hypothetical protein
MLGKDLTEKMGARFPFLVCYPGGSYGYVHSIGNFD